MTPDFLTGVTAMGCFVIALFFVRYWRATGDRFFALFAVAFGIFAINRVVLGLLDESSDFRPGIYIARLLAFAVIAAAILDKNRRP
jgi:hypothetical protein